MRAGGCSFLAKYWNSKMVWTFTEREPPKFYPINLRTGKILSKGFSSFMKIRIKTYFAAEKFIILLFLEISYPSKNDLDPVD